MIYKSEISSLSLFKLMFDFFNLIVGEKYGVSMVIIVMIFNRSLYLKVNLV